MVPIIPQQIFLQMMLPIYSMLLETYQALEKCKSA